MLPVTHGVVATRRQIMLYSVLLVGISVMPALLHLAGAVYGTAAVVLGIVFLLLAAAVATSGITDPAAMRAERRLFGYSIIYLFGLFGALVVDLVV
jgi:protoheme IX farnesyltransferase